MAASFTAALEHPWVAPLGAAVALLLWLGREKLRGGARLLAVLPFVVLGLYLAWGQLSLVDDAFITFRYARNLLEGQGPVWNPGERVEGITNFGWMLLLAGLSSVLPLPLEDVALLMGVGAYLGLLSVVYALESTLDTDDARAPPLATGLLALSYPVTAFASTGLEALGAVALVMLGALPLLRRKDARAALLAGTVWCMGGLLRMDHLLAWGAGLGWVLWRHGAGARRQRGDQMALLAYAASLAPFLVQEVFRYAYYGDWLPNTYYAKSAAGWYISQGSIYSAVFWMGTGLWVLLPALVAWPWVSRGRERELSLWALATGLLWQLYVLKVGGDFMVRRFLLPLVPLALLAGVRTAALLAGPRPRLGWLLVVLVGLTVRGASLIPSYGIRWELADEGTVYPIKRLWPLDINHFSFREGHLLATLLETRGIRPVIATSGIGMVGYYSRLEVVDVLGLTDATIAHNDLNRRGRPGHEKKPPPGYLEKRKVLLHRKWGDPHWLPLTAVKMPGIPATRWSLHRYDKDMVERLLLEVPELKVKRFEPWIRDVYFASLPKMTQRQAKTELRFLDWYYWDLNGRDALREELVERIEAMPVDGARP